ncbi:hypothetical protein SLEP1_g6738 [Rubroshorea leprosula]|uniref:Reverse transcriptase Ty1/copia-type domain-containing protein n=1 Tax=Rubroshorea leprosula TaxID=152421 RepID=A0AAV5I256_9ROSI|nr:hypothetical protein SLEP1_g6738 [Rubroshorea leprosula]
MSSATAYFSSMSPNNSFLDIYSANGSLMNDTQARQLLGTGCKGTLAQQSCPYTFEQNRRAKRKHRHILESVHALLILSSYPERFWGEATLTTVYLINQIPSSIINNKSSYECLHGILPAYDLLKVLSFDQPPLVTNPSIELFPSDSDANTFDELYDAFPHAPPSSKEDALPADNALDNGESSSLPSSVSPIGFDPVEPKNEILNPPSSCPTRIKTRFDGFVECYKACLVAKGFTQEYGIDYEETFAPVAYPTLVCSLIVIATAKGWKLFQMDVKNAFLNGDLVEEVYMQPPPGLKHPPNKVCQLKRALYGLKQAPRAWFAKFSTTISEFGFTSSPHDTTLFIRKTNHDDMIIIEDDISSIHDLRQFLSHKFEMKDLGVLSYFLGFEVTSSDDGYLLSQTKYASDLISKARLADSKTASTLLEPNV